MAEKLGIAYNLWDNIEMLPLSVAPIRKTADYICVIYQNESNWGNKIDNDKTLELYKRLGLIDDYFLYEPDKSLEPKQNETIKRNIGIKKCQTEYFQSMDVDEIYNEEEYKRAFQEFVEKGYDSSICHLLTYYGDSRHIIDPPEDYFVSLFFKNDGRRFKSGDTFGVKTDPSRMLSPGNIREFKREEIQMHHLSYVRKDIRQKLENMSASVNWRDKIDKFVEHYENWNGGDSFTPGGYNKLKEVKCILS